MEPQSGDWYSESISSLDYIGKLFVRHGVARRQNARLFVDLVKDNITSHIVHKAIQHRLARAADEVLEGLMAKDFTLPGQEEPTTQNVALLIPTAYELLNIARQSLGMGEWSVKLPLEMFDWELMEVVRATGNTQGAGERRRTIRRSDVYQRFNEFTPRAQVLILDYTHEQAMRIHEEHLHSQRVRRRGQYAKLYPNLTRYCQIAGIEPPINPPSSPQRPSGKRASQSDTVTEQDRKRRQTESQRTPSPNMTYHYSATPGETPIGYNAFQADRRGIDERARFVNNNYDPQSSTHPIDSDPSFATPYPPFASSSASAGYSDPLLQPNPTSSLLYHSSYSHPLPQQLAFNPNSAQHGQIHYTGPYQAPAHSHDPHPVPTYPSSISTQPNSDLAQDYSPFPPYPSNLQNGPPLNPRSHPPRHP